MTHANPITIKRVVMTTPEAASYLGLAISTLNKWRVYGGGPRFLKLGRSIRYRQTDLDEYLNHQLVASTAQY